VQDADPDSEPLVAVAMATFDPETELFERQLESLREQSHRNWVCAISDDASSPERFAELERAIADDPRFTVSRAERRLGFYRNFERALGMVPAEAELVAFADQDDRWDPDKLGTLTQAIEGAALAYSDARAVRRDGTVIS
jgi:O-antigen biosynthesis protein